MAKGKEQRKQKQIKEKEMPLVKGSEASTKKGF